MPVEVVAAVAVTGVAVVAVAAVATVVTAATGCTITAGTAAAVGSTGAVLSTIAGTTAAALALVRKHGLVAAKRDAGAVQQLKTLTSTQPIVGLRDQPLLTLTEAIQHLIESLQKDEGAPHCVPEEERHDSAGYDSSRGPEAEPKDTADGQETSLMSSEKAQIAKAAAQVRKLKRVGASRERVQQALDEWVTIKTRIAAHNLESHMSAESVVDLIDLTTSNHVNTERSAKDSVMQLHKTQEKELLLALKSSLAWAKDPARRVPKGAEAMTTEQAAAISLYTQETVLYRYLNRALREHRPALLQPFLPYMKLLLSGLYLLPLIQATVFRGVRADLRTVYAPEGVCRSFAFTWWSFSSTTRNKGIVKDFLGGSGHRSIFTIAGIGVDIAAFSAHAEESEILMLPATSVIVESAHASSFQKWNFTIAVDHRTPPLIDYHHPGWGAL